MGGNGKLVSIEKRETFAGPIPHPEIIERYERIYPGAAKIIFDEWNKQVTHRHYIEKSVIWTDNAKSLLGVIFGFITELSAVGGGIYITVNGSLVVGLLLVVAGFAMLFVAFFTNKKARSSKDLEQKDESKLKN